MRKLTSSLIFACALTLAAAWSTHGSTQHNPNASDAIDAKVRRFLESHRGTWHDLNVPAADGQKLHDIIVEHKYKHALEIGTSTGHSGIWIAWALSETGGNLITIEIDKSRHDQAVTNFKDAGLATYIDARRGDAHELVPSLSGPFDFVFCDADKDWYKNYFDSVLPEITVGGCFAAHNISEHGYGGYSREFLQYVRSLPNLETTVFTGGAGMSITYKKAEQ